MKVGKLFELKKKTPGDQLEEDYLNQYQSEQKSTSNQSHLNKNNRYLDQEFNKIHKEFEEEFWRTTDMHKKQPTYLVFHKFMYQRMKNQYPGKLQKCPYYQIIKFVSYLVIFKIF